MTVWRSISVAREPRAALVFRGYATGRVRRSRAWISREPHSVVECDVAAVPSVHEVKRSTVPQGRSRIFDERLPQRRPDADGLKAAGIESDYCDSRSGENSTVELSSRVSSSKV